MESLRESLRSKNHGRIKEQSEEDLIVRGYIRTKIFGWITTDEADWLNKNLSGLDFGKTVEELTGIPCYETEVTETKKVGGKMDTITKKITKIYPFVDKFYEMRIARELDAKNRIEQSALSV